MGGVGDLLIVRNYVIQGDDGGFPEGDAGSGEGFDETGGAAWLRLEPILAHFVGFQVAIQFHAPQNGAGPRAILVEFAAGAHPAGNFGAGDEDSGIPLQKFVNGSFIRVHLPVTSAEFGPLLRRSGECKFTIVAPEPPKCAPASEYEATSGSRAKSARTVQIG